MFATSHRRPDFSDTLAALPPSRPPDLGDVLEQMGQADRADMALLRLVLGAAFATLALALTASLLV
ncbi:MAG: hypothetical protein KF683_08455 [Rubrivivax sp.]|nr:hypothetical protein [Rubrivivax sp.]